jgi:hypothetical protein
MDIITKLKNMLCKNNKITFYEYISNSDLIKNMNEKDYPKFLSDYFYFETGEKLNIKSPKTFNEKIQWLKLYDNIPLKAQLTDKLLSKNWVSNKIGDEYIKPTLWSGDNFQDIPFDELPNSFIIKTNHGCKWNYTIKNKTKFLEVPRLQDIVKRKFDSWLIASYWTHSGLELQYKTIKPLIIIEPLLHDDNQKFPTEYEVFCFNGTPKIYQKVPCSVPRTPIVYNEKFEISDITFDYSDVKSEEPADDILKEVARLSKILAENFKLVRVDWLLANNKIYFNEMTFTPHSGFFKFLNPDDNLVLGNMLSLK